MVICPSCGAQIREKARFCHKCGGRLASNSPEKSSSIEESKPEGSKTISNSTLEELAMPPGVISEEEVGAINTNNSSLEDLLSTPAIATSEKMGNKYTESFELGPVLAAIKQLWSLLNSKREEDNQRTLMEVQQKGSTPQLRLRLATMAVFICRNVVSRYASRASLANNSVSDAELEATIVLAEFAKRYCTGGYATDAWKCYFLLTGLQDMRAGRLDPIKFAQRLREKFDGKKQNGSMDSIWTDLMAVVTHCLVERRNLGKTVPEEAKKWVQVFAGVGGLSEAARSSFLGEAQLHGYIPNEENVREVSPSVENESGSRSIQPKKDSDSLQEEEKNVSGEEDSLGFLDQNQRTKLLESMRTLRLDQVRTILREVRKPLLSALDKTLSDPSFDEILPPRRSFYLRSTNRNDFFPDMKKRITSLDKDVQRQSLFLLEQMARETPDKENAAIAREWLLFARAYVQGLNKAMPSWKEDYNKGIASWEEIWNLAVASVRSEDFIQALGVLKPGIKAQNAPVFHLWFALKCGIHILQHTESYSKTALATATVTFLLENLTKLPLPESYLTWILLANEVQDPINYNKQLYFISIFQDILDRPIKILRPDNLLEEATIEDFEQDFQNLLSVIQRLEDNYVFEPRNGRIGIKSKLLATYLRTSQIVPKRVGIFVDYENLRPLLPVEMQEQPREVGNILMAHASKYGDVVCRWVCAAPRNIPDPHTMTEGFKEAGFVVQFPQGRTGQLHPTENLTDFVLVECITLEMMHSKPDIYIIVSGDGDFFEKIMRLLGQGNTVRLIASASNLATRYKRLEQRSQQNQLPEGYGDFYIDNLNEILQASLVRHL